MPGALPLQLEPEQTPSPCLGPSPGRPQTQASTTCAGHLSAYVSSEVPCQPWPCLAVGPPASRPCPGPGWPLCPAWPVSTAAVPAPPTPALREGAWSSPEPLSPLRPSWGTQGPALDQPDAPWPTVLSHSPLQAGSSLPDISRSCLGLGREWGGAGEGEKEGSMRPGGWARAEAAAPPLGLGRWLRGFPEPVKSHHPSD